MRPMLGGGTGTAVGVARARSFFGGTWKGRILGTALALYLVEKLVGLAGRLGVVRHAGGELLHG